MRTIFAASLPFLLLALAPAAGAAEGPDLLFPGERGQLRLRLQISADGQAPETAWEAFLNKLFDHFDRDGDGSLSAAEAARVFPLPLAGGREAVVDFGRLDADRDGKGSRAELKAFYRKAGFTPVVVIVVPPAADDLRLNEALFRHLDRDGDGKLTKAELEKAGSLLRRLDENEDEVLTAAELLSPLQEKGTPATEKSVVEAAASDGTTPDAILRIVLGKEHQRPSLTGPRSKAIEALAERPGGPFLLRVAGSLCTVAAAPEKQGASFRAAQSFFLAQFKAAASNRPSIEKKHLEQDGASQVLAGLFDNADRDGDGKLSLVELDAFLALVGEGVVCQVAVTVQDRGRNLFHALDQDRNGRLDLRELNAAARLLAGDDGRPALARDQVPRQFQLAAERGTPGSSFGPVPLAGRAKQPEAVSAPAPGGPRWFRAMDRNGDGSLSPREFLGPPELFRRLDADGDGLIGVAEAERADANKVGP